MVETAPPPWETHSSEPMDDEETEAVSEGEEEFGLKSRKSYKSKYNVNDAADKEIAGVMDIDFNDKESSNKQEQTQNSIGGNCEEMNTALDFGEKENDSALDDFLQTEVKQALQATASNRSGAEDTSKARLLNSNSTSTLHPPVESEKTYVAKEAPGAAIRDGTNFRLSSQETHGNVLICNESSMTYFQAEKVGGSSISTATIFPKQSNVFRDTTIGTEKSSSESRASTVETPNNLNGKHSNFIGKDDQQMHDSGLSTTNHQSDHPPQDFRATLSNAEEDHNKSIKESSVPFMQENEGGSSFSTSQGRSKPPREVKEPLSQYEYEYSSSDEESHNDDHFGYMHMTTAYCGTNPSTQEDAGSENYRENDKDAKEIASSHSGQDGRLNTDKGKPSDVEEEEYIQPYYEKEKHTSEILIDMEGAAGPPQAMDFDESRRTVDGCFVPLHPPRKNDDGTFARPCGRCPSGMKWDEFRGVYAPMSKLKSNDKGDVLKKTRNSCTENDPKSTRHHEGADELEYVSILSQSLTDEESESALKAHKPRIVKQRGADLENRMADDGSFLPHPTYSELKRGADRMYKGPPGRCRAGTFWNGRLGRYVPKEKTGSSSHRIEQNEISGASSSSGANKSSKRTGRKARETVAALPLSSGQKNWTNKRPRREYDNDIASRSNAGASREVLSRSGAPGVTRNPAAVASKSTLSITQLESLDAKEKRRREVKIGSRVFAEYTNKEWYFATVVAIKRKPNSHYDQYSLLFDDDDFIEFVSIGKLILEKEYRDAGYPDEPPAMPKTHGKKLKELSRSQSSEPDSRKRKDVDRSGLSPMNLEQLLQVACGECTNCQKDDCNRCASCIDNASKTFGNRRKVCIQKMCCAIPTECKSQPMPSSSGFPEGWRYVIDPEIEFYHPERAPIECLVGLKLLPPTGPFEFYSVEAAKKGRGKTLSNVSANKFYEHLGGFPSWRQVSQRQQSASQSAALQSSLSMYCAKGSRIYCTDKEQWGIVENKFQLGNGRLRYSVRLEDDGTLLQGLDDAHVLAEVGYKTMTRRDPPPPPPEVDEVEYDGDEDSCEQEGSAVAITTDNVLVGRKLRLVWLDVNGRQKEVRGSITACEINTESDEVISCLVEYNQKSRALANLMSAGCGSIVPEFQWFDAPVAVGSVMLYEEQSSPPITGLSAFSNLPSQLRWITPDSCHEGSTHGLPHLKLAYRGCLLELTVGRSTIEGAGQGVFVSCTSLEDLDEESDGEHQDFQLEAGELLDLGVYGPHQVQDKKLEAVFIAKNYIHASKCEEWAFDPRSFGYQLDITDDITGDLHSLAKKCILPYVNESNDDKECIHAVHDPENSVHYLLGNSHESQRKFVLPCNGRPREVFINYGPGYEKVRVRKGYPFLSKSERRHLEKELEEDYFTDVEVMASFCEAQVEAVASFMFNLFVVGDESNFTDPAMIDRALTCAAVLQRRAKHLYVQADGDDVAASPVNLQKTLSTCKAVVNALLKLTKDESYELQRLQAGGNVEGLWDTVLKRQQFSDQEMKRLGSTME